MKTIHFFSSILIFIFLVVHQMLVLKSNDL